MFTLVPPSSSLAHFSTQLCIPHQAPPTAPFSSPKARGTGLVHPALQYSSCFLIWFSLWVPDLAGAPWGELLRTTPLHLAWCSHRKGAQWALDVGWRAKESAMSTFAIRRFGMYGLSWLMIMICHEQTRWQFLKGRSGAGGSGKDGKNRRAEDWKVACGLALLFSVVWGTVAIASLRRWLEVQSLRAHPRLSESKSSF